MNGVKIRSVSFVLNSYANPFNVWLTIERILKMHMLLSIIRGSMMSVNVFVPDAAHTAFDPGLSKAIRDAADEMRAKHL
ncbi:MAG: hypothetical protein BGO67_11435 [Alphaproteobacteria bacterium 41-28]|nr:MAG: hypothetical protein BGO67_11435 [Alphaproteobacteria bacterium 41-28]